MKLQIQPWPNAAGFMLSVNTHDQVLSLDPSASDAAGVPRAPGREPAAQGGDRDRPGTEAGLPTFLRYLREYIENRTGVAPPTLNPAEPGPS